MNQELRIVAKRSFEDGFCVYPVMDGTSSFTFSLNYQYFARDIEVML